MVMGQLWKKGTGLQTDQQGHKSSGNLVFDLGRTRMAKELGTGYFLRKTIGGGKEVTSWSGSLHLADASIANLKLDKNKRVREREIEAVQKTFVKRNYSRKLSALKFLEKVENATLNLKYLDGELRGKPWWKSHSIKSHKSKRTSPSYIPSLLEKTSKTGCESDPEESQSNFKQSKRFSRRRSSSLTSLEKLAKQSRAGRANIYKGPAATHSDQASEDVVSFEDDDVFEPLDGLVAGSFRQRADTGDGMSKPAARRERRLSRSCGDLSEMHGLLLKVSEKKDKGCNMPSTQERNAVQTGLNDEYLDSTRREKVASWLLTGCNRPKYSKRTPVDKLRDSPSLAWLSSDSGSSPELTPKLSRKQYFS